MIENNNIKNYDDWSKVKQKTNKLENAVKLREGEIRWCRFGINIGKEIQRIK